MTALTPLLSVNDDLTETITSLSTKSLWLRELGGVVDIEQDDLNYVEDLERSGFKIVFTKKDGIQLLCDHRLQKAMNMGHGKLALFKALETLANLMYLLIKMKVDDEYNLFGAIKIMLGAAIERMEERRKKGEQSSDDWNYVGAKVLLYWREQVILRTGTSSKIAGRLTKVEFDGEIFRVRIRTDKTTTLVQHTGLLGFSMVLEKEHNLDDTSNKGN